MIKALKRLNEALPGLLLGILIYGLLEEAIGIWFVSDKIRFTTGVLIGIGCAMGMGIHIAWILEESVRTEGTATRKMAFYSALRYVCVVLIFFAMVYFNLGNFYAAFIGVFGLKISAYSQPLLGKLFRRKTS
jgi:hypothetical protein